LSVLFICSKALYFCFGGVSIRKPVNSEERQIELIQSEIRQIPWLVKKYKRLFFELDRAEIESSCYFALFKASRRYDESKGYKFKTYADRCIRHEIFELAKKRGLDTVSLEHPVKGLEMVTIGETIVIDDFSNKIADKILVEEIFKLLNERERKLFVDYFFYGMEQWEIGEKLGMHSNSINRLIRIAKKKVQDKLH
jgi:RNA polymerase sigma-E/F/G factor